MTRILGILLAVAGVLLAVQSYRLQGAQGEIALLEQQRVEQQRAAAIQANRDLKNKERTDEEYVAGVRRAAAARVRVEFPASITAEASATGGGNEAVVCFDRRKLDTELAGWVERVSQRLTRVAQQGEGVAAAFRSCKAWALDLSGVPVTGGQTASGGRSADRDGGYDVVAAGVRLSL